jgi:hypothetical protein
VFAALVAEDVNMGSGPVGSDLFSGAAVAATGTNGADRARRPSGAGQSLFGGGGAASDVFAAPAATARSGGGDLFGSAAAPASQGSAWPSSGAAASGHDGGRVESLTGQRHENSVLFSLSNLQSLAMPSAKPAASPAAGGGAPVPEGSGLIDIRAMAASTLGSSAKENNLFGGLGGGGGGSAAVDDLPAFGSFSPAAPVLLPLPSSSGPPKWIYPLILVMLALVAGIIFMAVKVLGTKPPVLVEQVQQIPAPEQPKAAVPAEPTAKKPSTIAEGELPPRAEGGTEAKAGEKAEKGEHEHHHGGGHHESSKKGGADDKKNVVAAAAASSEPIVPKPKKGSLDELLDDATASHNKGGKKGGGDDDSKPAAAAGPLAKSAVVSGMNSVKPKVNACYTEFKVGGMAMVNIVIGKSGKVTSATVTGKFAGTPTGGCVEKAVKSATFPPSDGLTTQYPFVLR